MCLNMTKTVQMVWILLQDTIFDIKEKSSDTQGFKNSIQFLFPLYTPRIMWELLFS